MKTITLTEAQRVTLLGVVSNPFLPGNIIAELEPVRYQLSIPAPEDTAPDAGMVGHESGRVHNDTMLSQLMEDAGILVSQEKSDEVPQPSARSASESWKKHSLSFMQFSSEEKHEATKRALEQFLIDHTTSDKPFWVDPEFYTTEAASAPEEQCECGGVHEHVNIPYPKANRAPSKSLSDPQVGRETWRRVQNAEAYTRPESASAPKDFMADKSYVKCALCGMIGVRHPSGRVERNMSLTNCQHDWQPYEPESDGAPKESTDTYTAERLKGRGEGAAKGMAWMRNLWFERQRELRAWVYEHTLIEQGTNRRVVDQTTLLEAIERMPLRPKLPTDAPSSTDTCTRCGGTYDGHCCVDVRHPEDCPSYTLQLRPCVVCGTYPCAHDML